MQPLNSEMTGQVFVWLRYYPSTDPKTVMQCLNNPRTVMDYLNDPREESPLPELSSKIRISKYGQQVNSYSVAQILHSVLHFPSPFNTLNRVMVEFPVFAIYDREYTLSRSMS